MYSPPPYEEAIAARQSRGTMAAALPTELVLAILDIAIVQHRKDNVRWCLTLSLVCRTVRAAVLPVLYSVLFLDIKSTRERAVKGWDGRTYSHAQLAFLCFLINDPNTPPRQHIQHIVFRSDRNVSYHEMAWAGPRAGSKPAEWPFEWLTVRISGDMLFLYRAGLRPRRAFYIGARVPETGPLYSDLFSRVLLGSLQIHQTRTETQLWVNAQPALVSHEVDAAMTHVGHSGMTRQEIDPRTTRFLSRSDIDNRVTIGHLTVQLVNGDYLQQVPDLLLAGLATAFKQRTDMRIILACSSDFRLAGQTVSQFIRAAVPVALPLDILDGRIRVSHIAWAPISVENDMFHALAHVLWSGGDPWDEGYAV